MRDTLALAFALALPPRPSIERVPVFIQPFAPAPVVVRKDEIEPESFSTCYRASENSCWTER